jgi:hypothetical protein
MGSRGRAITASGVGTWRRAPPASCLARVVRASRRRRSSPRWRRGSSSFAGGTRAGARFERKLAEVGVELINAAPAHPQTLGKLERFHRTLKEWLEDEGPAVDLEHLQLLLDRFRCHYNEERPHQGIANLTPVERYLPGPTAAARLRELELAEHETPLYAPYWITRKVWDNGVVGYQRLAINVGRRYRGATVRLREVGELVHVYLGEELIHVAALDRNRRYQRRGERKRH